MESDKSLTTIMQASKIAKKPVIAEEILVLELHFFVIQVCN
jgi:hypothetical protein